MLLTRSHTHTCAYIDSCKDTHTERVVKKNTQVFKTYNCRKSCKKEEKDICDPL